MDNRESLNLIETVKDDKWSLKKKICVGILIFIAVAILIVILIIIIFATKYKEILVNAGYYEP